MWIAYLIRATSTVVAGTGKAFGSAFLGRPSLEHGRTGLFCQVPWLAWVVGPWVLVVEGGWTGDSHPAEVTVLISILPLAQPFHRG